MKRIKIFHPGDNVNKAHEFVYNELDPHVEPCQEPVNGDDEAYVFTKKIRITIETWDYK